MPDPLTGQLVADVLDKLMLAFPSARRDHEQAQSTADIYRQALVGLSGDAVRWAADQIIREDEYFPKPFRIRELARTFEAKHRVDLPGFERDELYCPTCRTKVQPSHRWRPMTDATHQHRPMATEDGAYLLLEPYTRDHCRCGPPCLYEPGTLVATAPDGRTARVMPFLDAPLLARQWALRTAAVAREEAQDAA